MGVPTSEVGYNSATARRGDHENSYEHVVALERERKKPLCRVFTIIYDMMINLLTAIGLTPGGSSTVHIYTQTIHRTT